MGKRGPAPKGEFEGKSRVFSTRIREDTRSALEDAARKSGRSLSQEIESRLQRTFTEDRTIDAAFGSRRNYALMVMLANVINWTENQTSSAKADWVDDPYSFDLVVRGINALLEHFKPPGPIPQTIGAATEILYDVQTADLSLALNAGTRRQHRAKMLRADMGDLADRPRLFGGSAAETRAINKLAQEFAALARKARRDRNALSVSEWRRLHDIREQMKRGGEEES
jgi:hypothetical protein